MSALSSTPEGLRAALDALLHDGERRATVRENIWASWHRSASSGLSPERFAAPHLDDTDHDEVLVRAARPVLDALTEDLALTNVGLVLTDRHGDILDRAVPERSLRRQFDRVNLAPGFVYAEPAVGTNGIGTAIAERQPMFVRGSEHFAEALIPLACAAAPVLDPRSGRVLGVVDLTCFAEDANTLMLPLVRRVAHDIEQRLLDETGYAERVVMMRFFRERCRAKHPMLVVNARVVIANTAAERLVKPDVEALLRAHAEGIMARRSARLIEIVLANGRALTMRCEPIFDADVAVGVVMHVEDETSGAGRTAFGLGGLTDTERSIAELVAEGLTNRQVAERVFLSRHTVDFHLRAIFRKVDVTSRRDLARLIVNETTTPQRSRVAGRSVVLPTRARAHH
jgi:transcriptional regulator of acetoin/glycerol metabolism/DNA-binding CsgD family transcriptional regulator